jgi:hypothetical protein
MPYSLHPLGPQAREKLNIFFIDETWVDSNLALPKMLARTWNSRGDGYCQREE